MILNLDIENSADFQFTKFPCGELNCTLLQKRESQNEDDPAVSGIQIFYRFSGSDSLFKLALAIDCIKREYQGLLVALVMPYIPAARQDQIFNNGESFSCKVYANFINSLKFDSVFVYDPHSGVAPALLDNVIIEDQTEVVRKVLISVAYPWKNDLRSSGSVCLISPDAGSNKKIFKVAQNLGVDKVVRCDKLRDTKTGEIIETIVYAEDLKDHICIVADDICSRGKTFIEISKKLKELGAEKVYLIVSHYEGTASIEKLKESGIDRVFTTKSLPMQREEQEDKTGFIKRI